jgi:murein DD-endopeptidase MepM/ murein hydrolase activator NlpD
MLIAIATLAVLLAAAAPALGAFGQRTLKMGSRGPSVRTLQTDLTILGWRTPVDGRFGRRTKLNVRRWERKNERRIDGRVSRGDAKAMIAQVTAQQSNSTRSSDGSTDTSSDTTAPAAPATPSSGFVFPIKGDHDYGTSVNRFGAPRGGRSHMGQDVLADCGLPVLAVEGGKVVYRGYQSAAGNYIVIKGAGTKRDYVYMHLRSRALYAADDKVATGARIGTVGDTGDATACHLHFELWTAPGWYNGGDAVDPLPYLKDWDASS